MRERVETFGNDGQIPVVFAHANGYPPGSYRQLFENLSPHCRITAIRHRPLWGDPQPPRQRISWQLFADDLIEGIRATQAEPVWLVGHSMGGTIGILAAATAPELFRGLVLLDPVLLRARYVLATRLAPRRTLRRMPMISRALRRPGHFQDAEAAFAFYRGKYAFRNLDDRALSDYVTSSLKPGPSGCVELAFPASWEAAIYSSAPLAWPKLARVSIPTLGLRGETSDTLPPDALLRWGRVQRHVELHTCPGGHLFPMEQPALTAQRVLDFLVRAAV